MLSGLQEVHPLKEQLPRPWRWLGHDRLPRARWLRVPGRRVGRQKLCGYDLTRFKILRSHLIKLRVGHTLGFKVGHDEELQDDNEKQRDNEEGQHAPFFRITFFFNVLFIERRFRRAHVGLRWIQWIILCPGWLLNSAIA